MPSFDVPANVFADAAARFPTPFYLYDENGIRGAMRTLNNAFGWCPGYMEYYAVKALPNPHVLNIIKDEGGGLDCASQTELMLAERCGFSGDRVILSANAMPAEDFISARRLGAFINLDDLTHVEFLRAHGGIPERVVLRLNPGNLIGHDNAIMGAPADAKFGMTRNQLSQALRKLKDLGVRAFGLHAFLSSNTLGEAYYPALARLLFRTGRELSQECGLPLFMVDLSGGIGIPYRPGEKPVDVVAVGEGVRAAYIETLGDPASAGVRVVTELGRYVTGPYGFLVTRAIHEKHTYKHYIGLDACAANLLRPAMYGAYHHITIAGKENEPVAELVDVTGSLCENNDKFAVDRMLPHIEIGDLVILHDAGAHCFSMGYNYNGKLRSAEVLRTSSGQFRLIRRAETPDDYFVTLVD